MSADAGLGALADLDFYCSAGLKIVLVNAKSPAGDLDDGVGTIGIKVLMETTLTGIVKDAQLGGGPCQ